MPKDTRLAMNRRAELATTAVISLRGVTDEKEQHRIIYRCMGLLVYGLPAELKYCDVDEKTVNIVRSVLGMPIQSPAKPKRDRTWHGPIPPKGM